MASHSVNFKQLRTSFAKRLAQAPQNGKFNSTLRQLSENFSQQLEILPREEFAMAWLLDAIAAELLNYSIEDDYIDTNDIHRVATKVLRNLLKSEDWLNQELVNFLAVCHTAAKKEKLPAKRVELRIPTDSGNCLIMGWVAEPGQPQIPVSSTRVPFVPILEESVSDPNYAQGVIDAFAERLFRLREEEKISCLCFIEKAIGPIGASVMLSALVNKLQLPACIYRENYWAKRAEFVGYLPKKTDRIAIVYDLLVTGDGIVQGAKRLRERFNTQVVAGVVLFGYDKRKIKYRINGKTVKIEAIGWYETFASQIEKIQNKETGKTENITILPEDRGTVRSSAIGRDRGTQIPPQKGGAIMKSSQRWNRSFGSYSNSELSALIFSSVKEFEHSIKLCWRDPDLKGVPRSSPDGRTLLVPQEAVQYFKEKGLKFKVSTVVSPEDLPREKLAEMRRKYGM